MLRLVQFRFFAGCALSNKSFCFARALHRQELRYVAVLQVLGRENPAEQSPSRALSCTAVHSTPTASRSKTLVAKTKHTQALIKRSLGYSTRLYIYRNTASTATTTQGKGTITIALTQKRRISNDRYDTDKKNNQIDTISSSTLPILSFGIRKYGDTSGWRAKAARDDSSIYRTNRCNTISKNKSRYSNGPSKVPV